MAHVVSPSEQFVADIRSAFESERRDSRDVGLAVRALEEETMRPRYTPLPAELLSARLAGSIKSGAVIQRLKAAQRAIRSKEGEKGGS